MDEVADEINSPSTSALVSFDQQLGSKANSKGKSDGNNNAESTYSVEVNISECSLCHDIDEILAVNSQQPESVDILATLTPIQEAHVVGFILFSSLDIKDRRHNLKKYRQCFVCADLVTWCVDNGLAPTRNEGTKVGRMLYLQNIIEHVTGDNGPEFADEQTYYRFVNPVTRFNVKFQNSFKKVITSRGWGCRFERANARWVQKMEMVAVKSKLSFERHHMIQDRKWRLKTYEQCFVGMEAVNWLIGHKVTESRNESLEMGQLLVDNNIWRHVVNAGKPFMDSDEVFYRFVEVKEK